jgi:DNA-binding SARP family transcriptional activator/tetratricopeptide (TPR) repeat protein
VNFRLLGPLEVVDDGRTIPLPRRKSRALLALLLLRANEVVSTDRLVDELWGERPPKTAVASLQNAVSRLRKTLGRDLIVSRPPGYELRIEHDQLDLARFQRLVTESRDAEPAERSAKLREALGLWRGEALADLADEPFAQTEILILEELRTSALEERIDADLAIGRHGELVGELEALVTQNPLRERLRGQLMLALYRSGRQADALGAFHDARGVLRDELGLEPGAELQRLERAILQHDPTVAAPRGTAEVFAPARKRVTLLYADVFTVEGDPEALHARTRGFLSEATAAVERHGGRIERLGADQIVAAFGLPVAHEDDALRAVRAAVEIRASGRREEGLEVLSAVETGEVLAVDDAVSGDVVIRCKRLARSAAPGEVLVGPQTLRLVRDAVTVKRGTVDGAVRLVDVQADAPAISRRFEAPMVGREDELARLRGLYERVRDGNRCAVVTIVGEAGIGKTRLVRELVSSIGAEARTLVGRCASYGEGATYLPLAEIVRSLGVKSQTELRPLIAGEEDAESVARRIAELAGLAEGGGAVGEAFWAVRRLLEALSREKPLVVVFDDVHWAEPTFLDLVEHLAEWTSEAPILVFCPTRPDLLETRAGWAGTASSMTSIRLTPLGRSQTLQLVDNLASEDELGREARERIAETAEGNPLFAEQLYAHAAEEGGLEDVPPSVDALLTSRLDGLDEPERALLQRAAVVGREFSRDALVALSPQADVADVESRLLSLMRKGLVSRGQSTLVGEDAFRFHHVLVRDVAYAGTAKSVRSELHERCADWLDGRPQGLDEVVGYHLEQAHRYRTELGGRDRHARSLGADAGDRLGRAGVRALMRGDLPAAANLLERATALLPSVHPHALELQCELGIVYRAAGDSARAEQLLAETVQSAATTRDRRIELRAEIELELVRLHASPQRAPERLLSIAKTAVPTLESLDDHRALGRAWFAIGYVVGCFHCQNAVWVEAAEQSLKHYRAAGWSTALSVGQIASALLYGPTPVGQAIQRCEELLANQVDERLGDAHVRLSMGGIEALRARFDEGHELISQARRSYEELGQSVNARSCDFLEGLIAILSGEYAEAEVAFRRSYETSERIGDSASLAISAAELADTLYRQARYDEAERLTYVSQKHAAREDLPAEFSWRSVRAKVLARSEDHERAEEMAREAVGLAARTDALFQHGNLLLDLAEVLGLAGKMSDAAAATKEALALYRRKGASAPALAAETRLRELAPV